MPEWVDGHTTGYYYEINKHKYISQNTYKHDPQHYTVKTFTVQEKKEHAHEAKENYDDCYYEEEYDMNKSCDDDYE
jgi:hypothetical protein